jgi:hypothetical protein
LTAGGASLWPTAGLAAAAHLAAGLFSWVYLRGGTPAVALPDRLTHVATAGWGWRLGWLAWIVAGLTLVALVRRMRRRFPGEPPLRAALVAAAAALAVDAPCDVAQASLLPVLAAEDPAAFERVERWLTVGGYTLANGLYCIAALLVTWAVARRGGASIFGSGLPLVAAGLWLAAAGATGTYGHAPAAAAATAALGVIWPLHLAATLERRRQAPSSSERPAPAAIV